MNRSHYATLDEVKDFANKVREAGGGNPIDALMPAVPEDSEQCLIAKNLNFNCTVMGAEDLTGVDKDRWAMFLHDKVVRDSIADALRLAKRNVPDERNIYGDTPTYAVVLPHKIGNVAKAFDDAMNVMRKLEDYFLYADEDDDAIRSAWFTKPPPPSKGEIRLLEEMLPYIDEATREAYALAGDHITADGKIIL